MGPRRTVRGTLHKFDKTHVNSLENNSVDCATICCSTENLICPSFEYKLNPFFLPDRQS
jgi:hypothetical protein